MHWFSFRPASDPHADSSSRIAAARTSRRERHQRGVRAITLLLVLSGLVVMVLPFALQWHNAYRLERSSRAAASRVAAWPDWKVEDNLAGAETYNQDLAASGQPVIGEGGNPFLSQEQLSQAERHLSSANSDTTYWSLLDSGDGIMATIRIPKISVTLPIYHGTADETLNSGIGHLYGTSLPVGGDSTHAVITGHRGLVSAMMFTRLDEMRKGDRFHIDVLNETLDYQVDEISVIEPNDVSKLLIRPGEDRVTLMTCTPYGINTQRLLVSGVRIHETADKPASSLGAVYVAIAIAVVLLVGGAVTIWIIRRRKRPQGRHAQ